MSKSPARPWIWPVLIGLLAIAASIGGIRNQFTQDDIAIIWKNAAMHDLRGMGQFFVKPYWPPPFVPALYRPHFRPPYGQRTPESGSYFQKESLRVSLWNIDSQDWNANVGGTAAGDRVLTLMLLWRRGTILFHDVHPKAATAVPRLLDATRDAGLIWDGCGEP